jgi:hypothetical protein
MTAEEIARGRITLPIERDVLGSHHIYCAALPPESCDCTCGLTRAILENERTDDDE